MIDKDCKNIAIIYICTGKYERFWDQFYNSCEKFFYPDTKKHYFVITESQRILSQKKENATYCFQKCSGWPYDTLMRFHWFAMLQDLWKDYDYCYYCNANSVFIKEVTTEIIPFPTRSNPLLFWCHTAHYDDFSSNDITTELNPISTAFVEPNVWCRCFGGGFFGGTGEAFLKMTLDLRDNIQSDLNNDIIAVWHDQSHIICYGSKHAHLEVGKDLICQEERNPVDGKCCMIFLNKEKNGGVDNLRCNGLKKRFRHLLLKVYARLLMILQPINLDKIMRKIAQKIKNRHEWYQ